MFKKLMSVLISTLMLVQYIGMLSVSAQSYEEFDNGGFEEGLKNWVLTEQTNKSFYVTDVEKKNGAKALAFASDSQGNTQIRQAIKVKKNTDYTISFDLLQNGGKYLVQVQNKGNNLNITDMSGTTGTTAIIASATADWKTKYFKFNSGDCEEVVFTIANADSVKPSSADYFDNFRVFTGLFDGGFETGSTRSWDRYQHNVNTAAAHSGTYGAEAWGDGTYIYQTVEVLPNTNYALSFWYRKKPTDTSSTSEVMRVAVADENGIANDEPVGVSLLEDSDTAVKGKIYKSLYGNWENVTEIFNTGDNTEVTIMIKSKWANGFYFDDVSLNPTVETGVLDGSFEHVTHSNYKNYQPWSIAYNTSTTSPHTGSKHMEWWGRYNYSTQTVNVVPNTDYTLSFWYKNAANNSDYVGLIIGDENYDFDNWQHSTSLIGWSSNADNVSGRRYPVSTNWTKVTENFNTGKNSKITVLLAHSYGPSGSDSSVAGYFDDVVLRPRYNTFSNAGFEMGTKAEWFDDASKGKIEIVTGDVPEGVYAAKLSGIQDGVSAGLKQTIEVKANTDYELSYLYKNETLGHNLCIYNANGELFEEIKQLHDATADWTQAVHSINSGENTTLTFEVQNCSADAVTYFDDFNISGPANAVPEILTARAWGYVAEGKNLVAQADGVDDNGDTVTSYLYQWQESADGIVWTDIEGATSDTYTVTDATKQYRVAIAPVGMYNTGDYVPSAAAATTLESAQADLSARIVEKIDVIYDTVGKKALRDLDTIDYKLGNILTDSCMNATKWRIFRNYVSDSAVIENVHIEHRKENQKERVYITITFDGRINNNNNGNIDLMHIYNADDNTQLDGGWDGSRWTNNEVTYTVEGVQKKFMKNVTFMLDYNELIDDVYFKWSSRINQPINIARIIRPYDCSAVKNGNAITVNAKILNENVSQSVVDSYDIISTIYDANNALVGVGMDNTAIYSSAAYDFSKTISIPENSDTTGWSASIFIWDMETMKPYHTKTPVVLN